MTALAAIRLIGPEAQLPAPPQSLEHVEAIVPPDADRIAAASARNAEVCLQLGANADEDLVELFRNDVRRFAVTIYSSRSDAHDWIAGQGGAWRRSMRCMQRLVEANVPVDAEIVITRPGLPQLAELAEVLVRIRPARVVFRMPYTPEIAAGRRVMLLPRLPLVIPAVEAAVARLERGRIPCLAENFPACAAPAHVPQRLCVTGADVVRCERCDPATCAGVPREIIDTFGWIDIEPQPPRTDVVLVPLRAPLPSACARCADEVTESTPSRALRMHLTRAAATGAKTLRIVGAGAFHHPDAASVLRDAAKLSFARVEVAGEASGLAKFTDSQLARLAGISVVDYPLFAPSGAAHDAHLGIAGASERTRRALETLRELAGVPSRPFAVLHDLGGFAADAPSWAAVLGENPRFRLTEPIDSDALERCIERVEDPSIRAALSALLPACCHPEAAARRNESECQYDGRFLSTFARSFADPTPATVRCSRCFRDGMPSPDGRISFDILA